MKRSPTEDFRTDDVDAWLADLLRASGGVEDQWSIYVHDVDSGVSGSVRGDDPMDTMSVIKVPLLLLLLELAHAGAVNLHERVEVTTDRKRLGTGVLSTLGDGVKISLLDAAVLMTTVSDNTATDIVFEAVGGPSQVNVSLASRGLNGVEALGTAFDWFKALATSMDPHCGSYTPEELFVKGYPLVVPEEALAARSSFHFESGVRFGVATAREMGKLLGLVESREYADVSVCEEALRILALQGSTSRIPRYLPVSTTVHHKAGDFAPFIANDVGIVRPLGGSPMVLSMFSKGNTEAWGYSEEVISRVARGCMNFFADRPR